MKPLAALAALAAAAFVATPIAAQAPKPNPYSIRLGQLTDLQRRAALRRAILDSGEKCQRVDKAALQGPYKNLVMWVARCDNKIDYGAFIGPDGSVQVSTCAHLRAVKWPVCRRLD